MTFDSHGMTAEELVAVLAAERGKLAASQASSAERLIHELQVHQIELEMQNRELRRAQQLLEESRAKYVDLYDLAPIGYCTFDAGGRVLEANVRAAHLFNTTRSDLVGRLLTASVRIDDRGRFRRHLQACFERRENASCELTVTAPGKPPLVIELVSTPLADAAGAVVGCKTTLHDISHAKLEEQRQTLLADAGELIASSLDITHTFAALALKMVPLLGDHAAIEVELDEGARTFASDDSVTARNRAPGSPQSQVMRTSEPIYGRSLMCLPLRARDVTVGVLTLVIDGARTFAPADVKLARSLAARAAMAVDNANLYHQARAAVGAREDVLAIVSHDLKNPLQAIRLNVELMTREAADDRTARSILRSVRGMQRLIDGLLDLARIESGHLVIAAHEHRIAGIVADIVEMMHPLAEAKGIVLRAPEADNAHVLRCDRDRILQVLSNIVGNALKFTDRDGSVTLDVDIVGEEARFVVRDTGRGIPREQLAHIFERYRQAERGAERHGSGLGLYIARGIVDAHRGRIDVDSELGAGTSVTVRLPGAATAATGTPPTRRAPVLVVDDDREVRDLVAAALAGLGYRVRVAANGAQALEDCVDDHAVRPGLVLADLRMPLMDGWQLCRAIKEHPALAAIPVVLLSAEPDVEAEARALGAVGVANKPIDIDVLRELVATYCLPEQASVPSP
jgi:PAS domain S-box-containing protein